MNRRVTVRGIVWHQNKLLVVRQNKYEGTHLVGTTDFWCAPGGGVDAGEPLLAALKRELLEELGVEPAIGQLLFVQQYSHEEVEHLEFFFHITNAEAFLNINLAETTHGLAEIAAMEFVDPANTQMLPTFLQTEDLAQHISTGNTKFFEFLNVTPAD